MCMGGAPKMPKLEKPAPPPDPAPAPAPEPPPPPVAPPPELVGKEEAPKVTAQKTARGQAQQAAKGTSSLVIPKTKINTTGTGASGGGKKPSSLNIPT